MVSTPQMAFQKCNQPRLHFLSHHASLAAMTARRRPWQCSRSAQCRASLSNLVELSIGVAIVGGLAYSALPLVNGRCDMGTTELLL